MMGNKDNSQFKLGLVLEGGGVKGAYQVGAIKALEERAIKFDGIVGTSIGAVNGALYLQGGFKCMLDVWLNMDIDTVYDFTEQEVDMLYDKRYASVAFDYMKRGLDKRGNFFDKSYEKVQEYFNSIVKEEDIRRTNRDYGVVAYCISDFTPYERMAKDIDSGKLVDYIVASATFPIFPPKVIDGKKYIDGGVYDNMPINLLLKEGYDNILVIRTNVMEKQPKRKQLREANVRYIAPKDDLGLSMLFSSTRVKKFMQMGYDDMLNALDNGLEDFLLGNLDCAKDLEVASDIVVEESIIDTIDNGENIINSDPENIDVKDNSTKNSKNKVFDKKKLMALVKKIGGHVKE